MRTYDNYTEDKYSFEKIAKIVTETGIRAIIIMSEEELKPGHYKVENMTEVQNNLFVIKGVKKVNAE